MGARYKREQVHTCTAHARRTSARLSHRGKSHRVASRRPVTRADLPGIAGAETPGCETVLCAADSFRRLTRAARSRVPRGDRFRPSADQAPFSRTFQPNFKPLRAPRRSPRAMHAPDACRVDFISLTRVLRVLPHGWCLLTITRCETAADLLCTGSRALPIDRSDGHDPGDAGDPRLRRSTTRSRVEMQWVTSHLTLLLCLLILRLFLHVALPRMRRHYMDFVRATLPRACRRVVSL